MQEKQLSNQSVFLENRNRLNVTGVNDVLGFDDETVLMDTELGQLTVKGQNLKVLSFTVETQSISVEGNIAALVYTLSNRKSALKRLFG